MSIRVLIVDDTALYRMAISRQLEQQSDIKVIGQAVDGKHALAEIAISKPDIVVLDMEMPEMNGLELLHFLKEKGWDGTKPRVIMFSAHGSEGAGQTIKALNYGAVDFVRKPDSSEGMDAIGACLIPKILAFLSAGTKASAQSILTSNFSQDRGLLVIAASTGGPVALKNALLPFPEDFPIPILIVQHMPPVFSERLAASLDNACELTVMEAKPGVTPLPGTVYIAPGGYHLTLSCSLGRPILRLHKKPPINGLRPAADILFEEIPPMVAPKILAAVFTGMGDDGAKGCKKLSDNGAEILTQTADSCVVYSMPKAVDDMMISHGHFTPDNFCQEVYRYHLVPGIV